MVQEKKQPAPAPGKQQGKVYYSKSKGLVMFCQPESEQKRYRQLGDGTMVEIKEPEITIDFSPAGVYDTSEIKDNYTRERVERRIESDGLFKKGEIVEFTEKDRQMLLTQKDIDDKARELEQREALQKEQADNLQQQMADFEKQKADWAADQERLEREREAAAAKQEPASGEDKGGGKKKS